MTRWFQIFLLLAVSLLASTVYSQSPDARSAYREIYNMITQAEQSTNSGDFANAASRYREIIVRLENFQRQYPEWEPDIVKFRSHYAKTQLQTLEGKLGGAPAPPSAPLLPSPSPAPLPAMPAPAAPVYTTPTPLPNPLLTTTPYPSTTPSPSLATEQPPYAGLPAKILPPPAPAAPTMSPAPTLVSLPPQAAPAPLPTSSPSLRTEPETPSFMMSKQAFQDISPSSMIVDTRRSSGLQTLARQVESEMSRLVEENRSLRAALAEAESRAAVASNYLKVLGRENEMLQTRLDQEVKRRVALNSVLTDELTAYDAKWTSLKGKVRELLEDAPGQTQMVTAPVMKTMPPTYQVPTLNAPTTTASTVDPGSIPGMPSLSTTPPPAPEPSISTTPTSNEATPSASPEHH
jgi:hypothetical protein